MNFICAPSSIVLATPLSPNLNNAIMKLRSTTARTKHNSSNRFVIGIKVNVTSQSSPDDSELQQKRKCLLKGDLLTKEGMRKTLERGQNCFEAIHFRTVVPNLFVAVDRSGSFHQANLTVCMLSL